MDDDGTEIQVDAEEAFRNAAVTAAVEAERILELLRGRFHNRHARRRALGAARRVQTAGAVLVAELSTIPSQDNGR